MKKLAFYSLFCVFFLTACNEAPKEKPIPDWNSEKSTQMNKELAIEQDLDIQMYIARHPKWIAEPTGTGLQYILLKETQGEKAEANKLAKIQYSVSLLDGTICYQTEADELDVFKIDNSEIESGIHEGIKKMRVGEHAKLIFPSHLAHGLIGDMGKIPPLSPLVVDIELIEIE